MVRGDQYVLWFKDVDKDDGALVGGKGANLGEMVQAGFPVPNGFIVTAAAYRDFLEEHNLIHTIKKHLSQVRYTDPESLNATSSRIKKEIVEKEIPKNIAIDILKHYHLLDGSMKAAFRDQLVAVRSSATAEDLKTASFAGQQETFLNIQGEHDLILAVKRVWASLFEARAIFYRHKHTIDHLRTGMAVPVQKMVESNVSGVMFTLDPVREDRTKIIIEAIYGLGELIVQGKVTPDHYELDKKTLTILQKDVILQDIMLKKVGKMNKETRVSKSLSDKQKMSDYQIKKLAEIGKKIEQHYYFPQDIEWAIEKGKMYIVQTRPVTTIESRRSKVEDRNGKFTSTPILRGAPASPGIATGPVKIIENPSELSQIERGDVLVAPKTDPDFVPAMRKAVAIVTERGGRTSHAAIVSRELGIPAIVGVEFATRLLKNDMVITVNGATGEVYKGGMEISNIKYQISNRETIKTRTKLYVNLAEPERALEVSHMDVDGVGLLRAEFMIASIGVHPKKLIDDGKKKVFVETLSDNIATFCKVFQPRPVVYRASDFKTNEYRNLKGGEKYEKPEENPMLGFRGCYRYIKDPEIFELEMSAIKKVRNDLGYKNLWLMLPFARTPEELAKVKHMVAKAGLTRSESFKLWLMVETPANVLRIEEFIAEGIDGVSIGSNDLTMLTLGVDRDNDSVASIFDERNNAVNWEIQHVIDMARRFKITSSICGQLPTSFPSSIEKLVLWGITSISVSPDVLTEVRSIIAKVEYGKN